MSFQFVIDSIKQIYQSYWYCYSGERSGHCLTKIIAPYSYSYPLLFEQIVILEDKTVVKSQMKHFCFNNAIQNFNSFRDKNCLEKKNPFDPYWTLHVIKWAGQTILISLKNSFGICNMFCSTIMPKCFLVLRWVRT